MWEQKIIDETEWLKMCFLSSDFGGVICFVGMEAKRFSWMANNNKYCESKYGQGQHNTILS